MRQDSFIHDKCGDGGLMRLSRWLKG